MISLIPSSLHSLNYMVLYLLIFHCVLNMKNVKEKKKKKVNPEEVCKERKERCGRNRRPSQYRISCSKQPDGVIGYNIG